MKNCISRSTTLLLGLDKGSTVFSTMIYAKEKREKTSGK
jgi:hypothetical protein